MVGVMYRKLCIYKRSVFSIVIFTILSLFLFTLAFSLKIFQAFEHGADDKVVSTFSWFSKDNISVAHIVDPNSSYPFFTDQIKDYLTEMCKTELETTLTIYEFSSFDEFNDYVYNNQNADDITMNFAFSYQISNTTEVKFDDNGTLVGDLNISFQTNSTND